MSTTAQDPLGNASAEPAATTTPSTPSTPAAPSTRSYTLFEEARTDTWTKLNEVEADSQEAALESLGQQKLQAAQGRFMAIPTRFVVPRKPKVETQIQISFD